MVKRGELSLPESLDKRQDAGIYDPHPKVGIGALNLMRTSQIGVRRALNAVGAGQHVLQEREPDLGRQSFVAPVVQLREDEGGDEELFPSPVDQFGARSVIRIGGVERRKECARV